jgi:hypothetical protein
MLNATIKTIHYRGDKYDPEEGFCEALKGLTSELTVTVPEHSKLTALCGRPVVPVPDENLPYRPAGVQMPPIDVSEL